VSLELRDRNFWDWFVEVYEQEAVVFVAPETLSLGEPQRALRRGGRAAAW